MRKLGLFGSLAFVALGGTALVVSGAGANGRGARRDPADASGPLDLSRVELGQVKRSVVLKVHTYGIFNLSDLRRGAHPRNPGDRFICLHIERHGARMTQLCFGKRHGDSDALGYAQLGRSGRVQSQKVIGADVRRPNRRTVVARFRPGKAGLHPHLYHWQMVSQWSGSACPSPPHSNRKGKETRHNKAKRPPVHRDPCLDRVPGHHQARFRLRPVQPVGCKDSGPSPVFNGSPKRKRVALTFDDGPSDYTPQILKILKHEHAKATFFEIGQEVPGRRSASRAIIEAGDELGNHSLHHENKPGSASMAATNARIRSATGFEPCLFRPPSGNFDSRVVGDARALGMTTVIWDVDPADWATPGTGAIYSRVVSQTRPGSIVIMHDGGGNRSETVAALPHIIHTLRGRGYHFVTVSKLLHQRMIVRPVG